MAQTVLAIGATGNIGIAAILGALRSGLHVLAVVRNQDSAKKIKEHVSEGQDKITVVEADHVFCSRGRYTERTLLKATTAELREFVTHNFKSNFSPKAIRGTKPCRPSHRRTMFSMAYSAIKGLADTNVRFNEIHLAQRVEVDVVAEQHGNMKSSVFGRVYANILADTDVEGCRVRVESESDVDGLRAQKHEA
ncbi:hypothetical protein LZ30DRAFT_779036 [Colletotrichum cereale]|nr:hypothetical protein LZ30DRAFT_779036 [Colletotrichum cereale]